MNWRFTLIVFLVFVALAVFAYTQREAPEVQFGKGAPTATSLPLLELAEADIEEVAVAGADGRYTLSRVSGGWEVDGEKASDTVDSVVASLAKLSVLRDLPADRDPDTYGFAAPTLTVTLKTAAGAEHVLQVGDDTATDYNVWVRLKDAARIVMISRSDIASLKDWLTTKPLAPTATPPPASPGTPGAAEGPAGTETGAPTAPPEPSVTATAAPPTATTRPLTPTVAKGAGGTVAATTAPVATAVVTALPTTVP